MQAYSEFMGFVTIVNGAVRGMNMKEDVPCSPVSVCVGVEVLQLGYFRQPNVAHYDSFHCMQ